MHSYWVLVAGLVIATVVLVGMAMMRSAASRGARIRAERRELVRENARLSQIANDRTAPAMPVVTTPVPAAPAVPQTSAAATPANRDAYQTAGGAVMEDDRPRHWHLFHRGTD